MHVLDTAVEAIAATQMGRFTRAQVARLEVGSPSLAQSRVRSGRWRRLTARVLALPGAPVGEEGDLWTVHLHVGADSVISHSSAARLHGLLAVPPSMPSLIVPAGCNRRFTGAEIHQRSDLLAEQVQAVRGLPTTTLARTLVDLAPSASRSRIETWFDQVTAERLLAPSEVRAVLEVRPTRGKPAIDGLIGVLREYEAGSGVEQGRLERALTQVLRWAGLPLGEAQYEHPGDGHVVALVDRAWPELRLIVECDGRRWHDRMRAGRSDRRRDATAVAAGWATVRYLYADLVGKPEACGDELIAIHLQRARDIGLGSIA